MILELDCPEGYVCRVHRGEIFKVADGATTHIKETLPLLAVTWKVKTAVKECLEKVSTYINDAGAEEVLMLVRNAGISHGRDVDTLQVPYCLQTPVKRSKNF